MVTEEGEGEEGDEDGEGRTKGTKEARRDKNSEEEESRERFLDPEDKSNFYEMEMAVDSQLMSEDEVEMITGMTPHPYTHLSSFSFYILFYFVFFFLILLYLKYLHLNNRRLVCVL